MLLFSNASSVSIRPKFRSYLPLDEELKNTAVLPPAKPGDVESIVKNELEAGKSTVVIEELVSTYTNYTGLSPHVFNKHPV